MACVCLLAVGAWRWGRAVRQRAILLYWQERCMHAKAPADRVVLDVGDGAWEHWKGRDSYALFQFSPCGQGAPQVVYQHHDWERFAALAAPNPLTALGPGALPPVIYCHEMRRPDGRRRLVAVAALADNDVLILVPLVVEPAPIVGTGGPKWCGGGQLDWRAIACVRVVHSARVTVFAGAARPADATSFDVRLISDRVTHAVHGCLTDQDTILFSSPGLIVTDLLRSLPMPRCDAGACGARHTECARYSQAS
jgi:hypothetical protein